MNVADLLSVLLFSLLGESGEESDTAVLQAHRLHVLEAGEEGQDEGCAGRLDRGERG